MMRNEIPKVRTRGLGVRENGDVEVVAEKRRFMLASSSSYTLDELLAGISPSNLHDETDWGPAVGNEVW
jgi:antitoxin MazE